MTVTHPYYPSGTPRLNHVAMSVPGDLLGAEGRADLCRFWREVFGFEELPTMTIDRRRLIFSCIEWDQFLFLIANDDPMRCASMDHWGISVGTLDEIEAIRQRIVDFKKRDDRVELIDLHADDQGPVIIHSLYVRYLLPMMCEVQWWDVKAVPATADAG